MSIAPEPENRAKAFSSPGAAPSGNPILLARVGLTQRESQALHWVSEGKRDPGSRAMKRDKPEERHHTASAAYDLPKVVSRSVRAPSGAAVAFCVAFLLTAFAALSLSSCATITSYDQIAFEKATAAKAEALALMDKATGSYSTHRAEVERVLLTIDKAYEYDRGRNLNADTVGQWEILRDPNGNLYGGFVRRWRDKGALKPDAIAMKKPDIAKAFDQIIQLEMGKRRAN